MKRFNASILFRGKTLDKKEWVYGYLFYKKDKDGYFIVHSSSNKEHQIDPETICQHSSFAGLAKDGFTEAQIYEGDILLVEGANKHYIVVWYGGAFRLVDTKEKAALDSGVHPYMSDYRYPQLLVDVLDSSPVRVVGNIYDNPTLIKYKKEDRPPIPD